MPYFPPLQGLWQGRIDGPGNERLHEAIELVNDLSSLTSPKTPAYAFVGFACDEGVKRNHGFSGAALGPKALRQALSTLPIPQEGISFYDCGNVVCEGEALEEAQEELAQIVETLLNKRIHPIVLGGGHELSWGQYKGIYKAFPKKKILMVNFDAHFDLRPLVDGHLASSGTSFRQISDHCKEHNLSFDYSCFGVQKSGNTKSLFNKAKALNVRYVSAEDFHLGGIEIALEQLESSLATCDAVYLSICLDVFAAAFAPGVSARQPLGLCPWHILPLLSLLAASGKVVSLDIAELSPPRDQDNITAQLGAALLFHYLAGHPEPS